MDWCKVGKEDLRGRYELLGGRIEGESRSWSYTFLPALQPLAVLSLVC